MESVQDIGDKIIEVLGEMSTMNLLYLMDWITNELIQRADPDGERLIP